ncbi:hypothetical protein [Neobacillus sp. YIM B06451]|uniref:hypothetical protein n=1 Tax=Neobacillus sp. YIM B06451 TaxID=3070994 RepID=UPI00292DE0E5|nr:hypothetical protein [Neobacillus sp. YIM B06451]
MVIQANMSPVGIVEVWGETASIFKKYDIPLTKHSLKEIIDGDDLSPLLKELNDAVGSSSSTCIEGG